MATSADLPALSGAERLLLKRAGVGKAGVLAARQMLALREQAWQARMDARVDSAVAAVEQRLADEPTEYQFGYDDGRNDGIKEGTAQGEYQFHQSTLEVAEEEHRWHKKPAKWCTEGLCAYVWNYARGEMVRGA